jgi:nitrate/nitrite-specific signal transduction histidine kinase
MKNKIEETCSTEPDDKNKKCYELAQQIKANLLWLLGHGWLLLIVIILLIVSICVNISHIIITSDSLVVTFIGILASIIVIGNFSYVSVIKSEMTKELDNLKEQQKEMDNSLSNILNDLQSAVNKKGGKK